MLQSFSWTPCICFNSLITHLYSLTYRTWSPSPSLRALYPLPWNEEYINIIIIAPRTYSWNIPHLGTYVSSLHVPVFRVSGYADSWSILTFEDNSHDNKLHMSPPSQPKLLFFAQSIDHLLRKSQEITSNTSKLKNEENKYKSDYFLYAERR